MTKGLAPFVQPLAIEEFKKEYYGPGKIYVAHEPLKRFEELLSLPHLQSADSWMRRWNAPVSISAPAKLPEFPGTKADGKQAPRLLETGFGLYYESAEKEVPALRRFCADLEMDLGLQPGDIRVEVLISPPETGAPAHFDAMSNFNLQITGKKKWWMAYNKNVKHPPSGFLTKRPLPAVLEVCAKLPMPDEMPPDAMTFEAKPGTLVFIPEGTWHKTLALEESFTIVFSSRPKRWHNLIAKEIDEILSHEETWREAAFGLADKDNAAQVRRLETLLAEFQKTVKNLKAEDLIRKWAAGYPTRRG